MRSRSQIAWFAALAAFASPAAAQTEPLIVQMPQISSAAAQRLGEKLRVVQVIPCVWKIVAKAERAVRLQGGFESSYHLLPVIEAVQGHVVVGDQHIGQRPEVEAVGCLGKTELPCRIDAMPLER